MSFGITPIGEFPPATGDDFPTFLQFRQNGTDLGDATVTVVDFTTNLTATRGSGATANVVTVSATGGGGGGGSDTVIVELTDDYTLTAADNNTLFWSSIPVVVTVDSLLDMPACTFQPDTGSVTLHPINGVLIDGTAADQVFSLFSNPNGVTLTPRYAQTDSYTTAGGVVTFEDLPDDPRANVLLAGYLDAKQSAPVILASMKMLANHTLTQADNGRTFYTMASGPRTVNIPLGILSLDFHFYLAVLTGATSTLGVGALAGVPAVWTDGMEGAAPKTTISRVGAVVEVRCTGDQDQFMCVSSPFWGDNGPTQITGNHTFTQADDGGAFEVTGTLNLTFPASLHWTKGVTTQLPASGTVSYVSSGGTLLNGATATLTRAIAGQRLVAVVPRTAVDSYDVTGA